LGPAWELRHEADLAGGDRGAALQSHCECGDGDANVALANYKPCLSWPETNHRPRLQSIPNLRLYSDRGCIG
jgi:hypothetical protein